MKAQDHVEIDELCSELWMVLGEREALAGVESTVDGTSATPRDSDQLANAESEVCL
jgi:hypothetical protein